MQDRSDAYLLTDRLLRWDFGYSQGERQGKVSAQGAPYSYRTDKRAWEEMLPGIYILAFLHVSKTCPAVSWFCSELHFSHTFLRANIASGIFFPFPSLRTSLCAQLLGCGTHLAHRFSWRSSVLLRTESIRRIAFLERCPRMSHNFSLPGLIC